MRNLHVGISTALLAVIIFFSSGGATVQAVPASTDGTVSFTVRTVTNGAAYSPKNVLAIWVKDAQGNFVISRKVMAASRKQHLIKWVASSGNNVVNATTGATLPNHQTHTVSWDCRDVSGNLVPDGIYEIWVEYTERNSNNGGAAGPFTKVAFTKGLDVVSLTPPDEPYFKDMVLNYTPVGVGLEDQTHPGLQFQSFPNPFTETLHVSLNLDKSGYLNVSVYDLSGKRVAELVNELMPAGNHAFSWSGASSHGTKIRPGVYFFRVVYQGRMSMYKIVYSD